MKATDEMLLAYVRKFRSERGYSPSIREICKRFGYESPGTVAQRLRRMRDKGLVDFVDRAPRTLRVIDDGD